ncbi:hypothetical protein GCM10010407_14160 [Rarobacter incanus]
MPNGAPVRAAARTALVSMLVVIGGTGCLAAPAAWYLAGSAAGIGVAMAVGVALFFSGTTALSMVAGANSTAAALGTIIGGAWIAKIAVLFGGYLLIRDEQFYDHRVFAVALCLYVIIAAVIDALAVVRARIPLVDV